MGIADFMAVFAASAIGSFCGGMIARFYLNRKIEKAEKCAKK
jgi:hypothetical protein